MVISDKPQVPSFLARLAQNALNAAVCQKSGPCLCLSGSLVGEEPKMGSRSICQMAVYLALLIGSCSGKHALSSEGEYYAGPIIDSHFHASPGASSNTLVVEYQDMLTQMRQHNVLVSVVSIPDVEYLPLWQSTEQHKFLVGPSFPCTDGIFPLMHPCFAKTKGWPDLTWLENEIKAGKIRVLGELLYVYYGISPTDQRLMPYYQLAVKYDIPVGVHAAHGPPPRARSKGCCSHFDASKGNPLLLKPLLEQLPKLKIWLMHAGEIDFHQQAIALMLAYPQVYADLSILNSVMPQAIHKKALQGFIDAGLEDQLMFGSDSVRIEKILARMEELDILSKEQKNKLMYTNAVRFFALTTE
jgi:uncharacterized protein